MTCTRSQLLALFEALQDEISSCSDVDCALAVIEKYKNKVRSHAKFEAIRDLFERP